MSNLDFKEREPELDSASPPQNQVFASNNALYERLQGQGRKSAIERFGWIAVPVAAVAIIGVAAITSPSHSSADNVGGPPSQTAASAAPAAGDTGAPPAAPAPSVDNSAPAAAQPGQ